MYLLLLLRTACAAAAQSLVLKETMHDWRADAKAAASRNSEE